MLASVPHHVTVNLETLCNFTIGCTTTQAEYKSEQLQNIPFLLVKS